jgi:DNA polymerase-1
MLKITPNTFVMEADPIRFDVEQINSIEKIHKPLRQESKVPTFALTYDGTFNTLMTGSGFSKEKAKLIEARYHELYKVSDDWVSAKLDQASKVGYVTVAFGLRVRTPLLRQVIRKTRATPYEAEAEGRSAGNALGQSWCLLNTRAHMAFMKKVRASKHRLDIRPCSQIHDAGYYLIRDNIKTIQYTNFELVKEVQWQEHPDIRHDLVKLSGKLAVFYPDWGHEITIKNNATEDEIFSTIDAVMS